MQMFKNHLKIHTHTTVLPQYMLQLIIHSYVHFVYNNAYLGHLSS